MQRRIFSSLVGLLSVCAPLAALDLKSSVVVAPQNLTLQASITPSEATGPVTFTEGITWPPSNTLGLASIGLRYVNPLVEGSSPSPVTRDRTRPQPPRGVQVLNFGEVALY